MKQTLLLLLIIFLEEVWETINYLIIFRCDRVYVCKLFLHNLQTFSTITSFILTQHFNCFALYSTLPLSQNKFETKTY